MRVDLALNTSNFRCSGCYSYGHKQMHVLGFVDCVVRLCPACWAQLKDEVCKTK